MRIFVQIRDNQQLLKIFSNYRQRTLAYIPFRESATEKDINQIYLSAPYKTIKQHQSLKISKEVARHLKENVDLKYNTIKLMQISARLKTSQ